MGLGSIGLGVSRVWLRVGSIGILQGLGSKAFGLTSIRVWGFTGLGCFSLSLSLLLGCGVQR